MAQPTSSTASVGKQRILSANITEFNKAFLESLFASYFDKTTNTQKQSAFNANDHIMLTHSDYEYVKEDVETSLGMLFMNRYLLEYTGIIKFLGYWNIPLHKKGLGRLNMLVNNLVITSQIDTKTLGLFIDRRDKLGFQSASFLSSTISPSLVRPMNNVKQLKLQLLEKYP